MTPVNHDRADPQHSAAVPWPMDFRTRSISQVIDDLVARLEAISPRHPDRPRLIRMILDLRCEIERRLPQLAGDC